MAQTVFKRIAEIKKKNLGNNLDESVVLDLIRRVTESDTYRDSFIIRQIPEEKTGMDRYRLSDENGKIVIEATSGVAAAVAFNTYLKEKCHSFFGPITKNINLPSTPPKVGEPIENNSVFLYRYFMNYVTYAYTCIYYKWEDYERLTDWMLLAGINLLNNPVGHEIVWRDTLVELGYTPQEANDDLCGAGNLPWQIMGNFSRFGGDIPEWWFEDQRDLGNKLTAKMRSFGGDVIKPAFYGKVPVDILDKYPDAKIYEQGDWNLSQPEDRPPLLDTKDPLFQKFAEIYYRKSKEHFGIVNYYGGDPFYEGGETSQMDIGSYAEDLIEAMKTYSDARVWFFQGWSGDPRDDVLKRLSKEEVLIGFLSADRYYSRSDLFAGYPWMYMQIAIFGGNRRLEGDIPEFLQEPFAALSSPVNDLLVGTGMAMEAVEADEIIFDILAVNSIRSKPLSVDAYLRQHFTAKYGEYSENVRELAEFLTETNYSLWDKRAYKCSKASALCTCPNINVRNVGWFESKDDNPCPIDRMKIASEKLLREYDKLKDNECYRFDLMELVRQQNANMGWVYIARLRKAYNSGNKKEFEMVAQQFMKLFDAQDALMKTHKNSLLGTWIQRARDYGRTETEKRVFEYNVKNLFTLWCGKWGWHRLRDYSHREYSGLISNYYKRRWDAYLTWLSLHFNRKGIDPKIKWTEHDYVFTLSTEDYPTKPSGDLKKACEASMKLW